MPSDVRSDPNEVVADIVGRNYLVAGHLVASDGGRQRDGIAKHSHFSLGQSRDRVVRQCPYLEVERR